MNYVNQFFDKSSVDLQKLFQKLAIEPTVSQLDFDLIIFELLKSEEGTKDLDYRLYICEYESKTNKTRYFEVKRSKIDKPFSALGLQSQNKCALI